MAYDKNELYQKAKNLANKNVFRNIKELYVNLDISHNTFHKYFPKGSEEFETFETIITKKKLEDKKKIRKEWKVSNSAALQIAYYKLIADPEEREILNNSTSENQETELPTVEGVEKLKNRQQ